MAELKYRFIEDFPRDKGEPDKEIGSPKLMSTKRFGQRMLHRIARVEYKDRTDDNGNTIKVESMGERGGWIESYSNLSQEGNCWVHSGAIVCMSASVSGDAQVKSGEIGDWVGISDRAVVKGSPEIKEGAMLIGDAYIDGNVKIEGKAIVGCVVSGGSKIKGNVRLMSDETFRQSSEKPTDDGEYPMMKKGLTIEDSEIEGDVFVFGGDAKIQNSKISGSCVIRIEGHGIRDADISGESIIHGSVIGPIALKNVFIGKNDSLCGDVENTLSFYREIKGKNEYRSGTDVVTGFFKMLRDAVEFAKKG